MPLKAIAKYFSGISPMFLDGALYCGIAIFQFLQAVFSSDEAGKFINLQTLFWIKTMIGCSAAGLLAIKLFRSTTYSDHKKEISETQQWKKSDSTSVSI